MQEKTNTMSKDKRKPKQEDSAAKKPKLRAIDGALSIFRISDEVHFADDSPISIGNDIPLHIKGHEIVDGKLQLKLTFDPNAYITVPASMIKRKKVLERSIDA